RREDEQQRDGGRLLAEERQDLQRRGIDPVQVLDDEHRGLEPGGGGDPGDERCEQAVSLLLRRELGGGGGVRHRDVQQGCRKRNGLGRREAALRPRRGDGLDLLVRRRIAPPRELLLQHVGQRIEGAVLVVG